MKISQDKKLGFDDVSLISREISCFKSREEINPFSTLFNIEFRNPIIASPMKDVCNGKISELSYLNGGFGIIHRFCHVQEQLKESKETSFPVCAIGITQESIDRFIVLYHNGIRNFCIDVANSSNFYVKNFIKALLLDFSEARFIVGNILTREGIKFYEDIPEVVGFRVSVASGSACTTKNATGMYYPIISLLQECRKITEKVLIADGGIKEPQDYCKSIAAGADFIMLGSLISQTKESPAELVERDGKKYKLYHGSASFENQKFYKETPKYIEGKSRLLLYKNESIIDLMSRFYEGLVSSMSYANASNIEEYRKNVEFIKI